MSTYYQDQMKRLVPVDDFKASIKVRSSSGETNWMELNADCFKALRLFYRANQTKLNAPAKVLTELVELLLSADPGEKT
jgi:hypothetical protein